MVKQVRIAGLDNSSSGKGGVGEHANKSGFNADAGGCGLAGAGSTRRGSKAGKWADIGSSKVESNCSAGAGNSRAMRKASSAGMVQRLIDDIRSVALVDFIFACADDELTPLVNKRRLSSRDRECIRGWQSELDDLRCAGES